MTRWLAAVASRVKRRATLPPPPTMAYTVIAVDVKEDEADRQMKVVGVVRSCDDRI
jgi:hypothetical protein